MKVVPKHVAIIMDGNGRWAERRGQPRVYGHQHGAQILDFLLREARDCNIKIVTLYALSTENFQRRSDQEVSDLIQLFAVMLEQNQQKFIDNHVRVKFIGDRAVFPQSLKTKMSETETLTAKDAELTLVVAVNYSGRWDIFQATQAMHKALSENPDREQTPEFYASFLSLSEFPDPELLIRTGGDIRLSNFLLWDLAYTELYFTKTLWPDFNQSTFADALSFYDSAQRRFGAVTEVEGSHVS